MKIEVPHSKDSEDYIKRVFSSYKEVSEAICKPKGRCVIHMYPFEDTMIDGQDDLHGYIDAYLCELRVYDVVENTVYKYVCSDAIHSEVGCSVKVFKDLSTMLTFDRPISIGYGSATFVYSIIK